MVSPEEDVENIANSVTVMCDRLCVYSRCIAYGLVLRLKRWWVQIIVSDASPQAEAGLSDPAMALDRDKYMFFLREQGFVPDMRTSLNVPKTALLRSIGFLFLPSTDRKLHIPGDHTGVQLPPPYMYDACSFLPELLLSFNGGLEG